MTGGWPASAAEQPADDRPATGPGSLERDLEYLADWEQGGEPE